MEFSLLLGDCLPSPSGDPPPSWGTWKLGDSFYPLASQLPEPPQFRNLKSYLLLAWCFLTPRFLTMIVGGIAGRGTAFDDAIDDAVFFGFFGGHKEVSFGVFGDAV